MKGAFIAGTGTGVGKTWVAAALAQVCAERGKRVVAIKPIETGADPDPLDAITLANACGDRSLADAPGLYRAAEPLAPYAIEKRGGNAVGSLRALAKRGRELGASADFLIVEGLGGVLVPLDRQHAMADLITQFDLPTILVARNALGVLSYTLTAVEALRKRKISVRAIVLVHVERAPSEDLSRESNAEVLTDYLPRIPVLRAPRVKSPEGLATTAAQLLKRLEI